MKNKINSHSQVVRVDTSPELGAEIRRIAAGLPGVKIATLTNEAIIAGLPIIKRQLVEKMAKIANDD